MHSTVLIGISDFLVPTPLNLGDSMSDLIKVGDLVTYERKDAVVLSLNNGKAVLEGVTNEIPVHELWFPSVTPELIARFLLSRKEDNLPGVIVWMKENETERRPQVLSMIHNIIASERHMSTILLKLRANSYVFNNTVTVSEEILEHLIRTVEQEAAV